MIQLPSAADVETARDDVGRLEIRARKRVARHHRISNAHRSEINVLVINGLYHANARTELVDSARLGDFVNALAELPYFDIDTKRTSQTLTSFTTAETDPGSFAAEIFHASQAQGTDQPQTLTRPSHEKTFRIRTHHDHRVRGRGSLGRRRLVLSVGPASRPLKQDVAAR